MALLPPEFLKCLSSIDDEAIPKDFGLFNSPAPLFARKTMGMPASEYKIVKVNWTILLDVRNNRFKDGEYGEDWARYLDIFRSGDI
jgi:hypothetical protein